ncbi:MAG: dihydroxyacetone kinase subunit DhaL [Oscillospiraceae bacterium]|nr:dihydroxyacetone kinase subunit DhaL [Oscillospiraceae bacterium]
MADSKQVLSIIQAIGEKIESEKDYLTELDQPIGDSDHGINMARGFAAVEKKLPTLEGKDIGSILKAVGITLVSTVGGASGPLYGTAFMRAGMAAPGKLEIDMDDFLKMLDAAVQGVEQRGHSTTEEATMIDAMVPALTAMQQAAAQGKDAKTVLEAGTKAAWAGVEHTKGLVATKGRASYMGERGIGHQDPGATSFAYVMETISSSLA